jgi:hypothetical protein
METSNLQNFKNAKQKSLYNWKCLAVAIQIRISLKNSIGMVLSAIICAFNFPLTNEVNAECLLIIETATCVLKVIRAFVL